MRSMVEGACNLANPSVSLRLPPPRAGEDHSTAEL